MNKLLFIIFLLIFYVSTIGQPVDPGGGGDPFIPIDGGVGFALAAGAAYGSKVIMDMRKKNKRKP